MRIALVVFPIAAVLSLGIWVSAMDGTPCNGQPKAHDQSSVSRWKVLEGLSLSGDQKERIAALEKEYAPRLKATAAKVRSVLTADQKKARDEAAKAARAAGKKGKDVVEAVKATLTLSDAQKAKMAEVHKEIAALRKEVKEKIAAVLTPEQKAQLKKLRSEQKEGHTT